jgi:hypothetical protein
VTRRLAVAFVALLPVAPVLAWSYGLGSFRAWFLATTLPALVALAVIAWRATDLRPMLAAGAAGGLFGTIGYDVFRVPFAVAGVRLFAPIDSYGVLLMGAHRSSDLTGFAGWAYHLSNGVGFGIAYALVAYGRRQWWAVGWAMLLETATVVTPFATMYGLRGKWDLIGVAYAAHVFYGLPLGYVVQRRLRPPATRLLGVAVLGLAVWHLPLTPPGRGVATIRDGRLTPEWLRAKDGCVVIRNEDTRPYPLPPPFLTIGPGSGLRACGLKPGVVRLKLSNQPYSGGFVIIDPR